MPGHGARGAGLERQSEAYVGELKRIHAAVAAADFSRYPDLPDWPSGLPDLAALLDAAEEGRRWDALAEVASVASDRATNADKRRVLVEILAAALDDPSARIARSVGMWLLQFDPGAFNEAARDAVAKQFLAAPDKQAILLAGRLGIDGAITRRIAEMVDASSLLSGTALFASPEWAALLASARSGDPRSIRRVVDAVAAEGDPVMQVSRLLHEVAYVRQPEVVALLRDFLFSDDRLPSPKSTAQGVLFAQHAAAALADMLEDFPIVKEYARYSTEDIRACRDWMAQRDTWRFRA